MKDGEAAGWYEITTEQIKNLHMPKK